MPSEAQHLMDRYIRGTATQEQRDRLLDMLVRDLNFALVKVREAKEETQRWAE